MKKLILPLVASIGMMACGDDNNTSTNVDFVVLNYGKEAKNNNYAPAPYIINSEEQWQDFLESKLANDAFNSENINFLDTTILAVVDKTRPDGRYGIAISQIVETTTTVNVTVKLVKHNGMATLKPITPYSIVKTNKINKPISWQYINE